VFTLSAIMRKKGIVLLMTALAGVYNNGHLTGYVSQVLAKANRMIAGVQLLFMSSFQRTA